jgi:arylsulfatase A-like enzyme
VGRLQGPFGLVLALSLVATGCRSQPLDANPLRPNILFLLAEGQRADSIGDPRARTPNLDRLAWQGVRFDRAYCMGSRAGSVCGSSRAMLLSGRGLFRLPENPIDLGEGLPLWPELLRRSGYRTFGAGQWHNGRRSFARCFDDGGAILFAGSGDPGELTVHDFDPTGEYANARRRAADDDSSETLATRAVRFLEHYDGAQPFCLVVAFTAPRDPRTTEVAPAPLADDDARIAHLDSRIGRILDALEAAGRGRDTYVIFSSDHGPLPPSHGPGGGPNLYEHSMRVPLIVRGPGIVQGRSLPQLTYLHDLAPTMCALAGAPALARCDGRDLSALLFGRPSAWRDSILTAHGDARRALCGERLKLIEDPAAHRKQLYDLGSDPQETNDLSADPRYAGLLHALEGKLREEQRRAGEAPLPPR